MTQAQYRDATYSLVVITHALAIGFLFVYGMDKWRGTKWLESHLMFLYALLTLLITVLTIVLFILGWAGTSSNTAKL